MLKILVLICPIAVDHAACNIDTAIDVIRSTPASSPQQCGFLGQAMLAPTALAPDPSKQYVKILCVRAAAATLASRPALSPRSPMAADRLQANR